MVRVGVWGWVGTKGLVVSMACLWIPGEKNEISAARGGRGVASVLHGWEREAVDG